MKKAGGMNPVMAASAVIVLGLARDEPEGGAR